MISRNKQQRNIAKLEESRVFVDSTVTKGAHVEWNLDVSAAFSIT